MALSLPARRSVERYSLASSHLNDDSPAGGQCEAHSGIDFLANARKGACVDLLVQCEPNRFENQ